MYGLGLLGSIFNLYGRLRYIERIPVQFMSHHSCLRPRNTMNPGQGFLFLGHILYVYLLEQVFRKE